MNTGRDDLSSHLFDMGLAMARAQAAGPLPYQDLLTPAELIDLAATSQNEVVRRRAAAALYLQGQAHGMRTVREVVAAVTV